jgi:hypothetical protein
MNSWLRVPLVRGRTCGVRQKCPGGSLISLVRAMPERGVFAPGFLRVRSAATSAVLAAPAFLRASSSPRPLLPCLRFPSPQRNPSNEVLSAPTLRPRSTPERSLPSHPTLESPSGRCPAIRERELASACSTSCMSLLPRGGTPPSLSVIYSGANGVCRFSAPFRVPVSRFSTPPICGACHSRSQRSRLILPQLRLNCGSSARPSSRRTISRRRRRPPRKHVHFPAQRTPPSRCQREARALSVPSHDLPYPGALCPRPSSILTMTVVSRAFCAPNSLGSVSCRCRPLFFA